MARVFMSDTSPQDALIKSLLTDIRSIAKSKRFIDWGESGSFSASLAQILSNTQRHLLPNHPTQAIKVLDLFLSLGERVMNRCDDSNGDISGEFREAFMLWGKAWAVLPDFDAKIFAQSIWKHLDTNDYGLADEVIPASADALKRKGLDELETLVKSHHHKNTDSFPVFHALRDIALLRQSPEAFQEVFKFTGRVQTISDQLDFARLLIKSTRNQEAIILLESIDDTAHYGRDSLDLLIELYSLEGNTDKAQQLRWRGFMTRSDLKYYQEYVECLADATDKGKALSAAIEHATNHQSYLTALQLLNDLGQPDKAASVFRQKYDSIDGNHYHSLKGIAKDFSKAGYTLEAVLIYRRLAESILSRAKSKYYDYAIGYLKKSMELGANVHDWINYPSTTAYFEQLRTDHAKKPAFMKSFVNLMTLIS